jgi:hemin uptake protein HemP
MNPPPPSPHRDPAVPAAPRRPPLLDSQQLLQGHRTVEIRHNGELYRLQATRTGKLILTK